MSSSSWVFDVTGARQHKVDLFHANPNKTKLITIGFCRENMLIFVDSIVELILMFIILTESLMNDVSNKLYFNQFEFTASKGRWWVPMNVEKEKKFIKWIGQMTIEANSRLLSYIGVGNDALNHVLPSDTWIGFCIKWEFAAFKIIPIINDDDFVFVDDVVQFDDCESHKSRIKADVSLMFDLDSRDDFKIICHATLIVRIEGKDDEIIKQFFHAWEKNSIQEQRSVALSVLLSKGCCFNVTGLLFSDKILCQIYTK